MPEDCDNSSYPQIIGVLWRHLAFEKYGKRYKRLKWETVQPPSRALWRALLRYERWSYPSLFEEPAEARQ